MNSLILLLSVLFFTACSKQSASNSPIPNIRIQFNANNETAVSNGAYKVYIGRTSGFQVASAISIITIPGSAVVDGVLSAEVALFEKGKYYAKVQALSNLVDPYTNTSAASELSDEVSFEVK